MTVRIINGDCLTELPKLAASGERFHACVTDPPYHLTSIVKRFGNTDMSDDTRTSARSRAGTDGYARSARGFMGKRWDGGDVAFRLETWRKVYDCLLPGAFLLAFGGTRGWHRLACAIEDAGFEIRDTVAWLYGSGFPKSLDVSKAIDKAAGATREVIGTAKRAQARSEGWDRPWMQEQMAAAGSTVAEYQITAPATSDAARWQGWGTALKPAFEPIIVARKPLDGTVAANVLKHGCGGMNIDASRIAISQTDQEYIAERIGGFNDTQSIGGNGTFFGGKKMDRAATYSAVKGRWPANVIHDGSEEVLAAFQQFGPVGSNSGNPHASDGTVHRGTAFFGSRSTISQRTDWETRGGSAARFFYSAKADSSDRVGSNHPTVKPTDLMRYLVRLVTPPGGTVIDPFCGTGSTLLAADQLQFNAVGIEADEQYAADARRKFEKDAGLFADIAS